MKNILVTGGAGFIGSHLCITLLENNYGLYVLDSYLNSYPKAIKRIKSICNINGIKYKNKLKIFSGDLREKKSIENLFNFANNCGESIDSVIHLAGLKSVYESILNPLSYWENNLISTINLVDVMAKNNCFTIVFSSSASIYENKKNLIDENTKIVGLHPYANTKIALEKLLNDVFISDPNKWRVANLRYFNPIGAHESGLIGEDPSVNTNNIFPRIIQAASKQIRELKIYGKNWPTIDGTGIRDYIHVMDLADGHLSALSFLNSNKPNIFNINLGTGKGTSVLELINIFEEINKVKVPYSFVDRRKGDSAIVVADNSLAKSLLNFVPRRNINSMCRDGWCWHLKNFCN
ncbi:UDP-glucose 4-epimerase GalE [uncultured Prochlorococcus sp.]|uniref:UDP-glucose 4-epimerase GalE n=1 Tax=uncultured Prochlorococcus sp. TaxID=159733 RepID=UPI00258967D2|nr:UDP-glucose 4-epimerase GalE [uncultured Prochlorococcus sp.]